MEKPIIFAGENPDDMNYPIGIQTFAKLRENDFSYVDKTALVYKLTHENSCYFLSRPRRFGKSMLLSTLKTYFQGKKEEFEGLAISKLEKEWKQFPVLHLDLSAEQYNTKEALISRLNIHLERWEKQYCGVNYSSLSTARFSRPSIPTSRVATSTSASPCSPASPSSPT